MLQCSTGHNTQSTHPVAVQLIDLRGQLGSSAGLLHSLLIGHLQQITATILSEARFCKRAYKYSLC